MELVSIWLIKNLTRVKFGLKTRDIIFKHGIYQYSSSWRKFKLKWKDFQSTKLICHWHSNKSTNLLYIHITWMCFYLVISRWQCSSAIHFVNGHHLVSVDWTNLRSKQCMLTSTAEWQNKKKHEKPVRAYSTIQPHRQMSCSNTSVCRTNIHGNVFFFSVGR